MWRSVFKTVTPLSTNSYLLSAQNNLQQQIRTTFVLKRRIEPRLNKKGLPPKNLRTRNYLYEFVKDTNLERLPDLEVILTSYVDGVGNVGDKVSLRPNYAYNELLVPGLAVYATPENVEKYKNVDITDQKHYSSPKVLRIMQVLSNMTLGVIMNKDSPWTLQPWHIRASFRKCGYIVPEYAIQIPEKPIKGPDMNIESKDFYITVTINKTEQVKVRCQIHHWSTDITERLPYNEGFWKQRGELIFPEDAEIEKADKF